MNRLSIAPPILLLCYGLNASCYASFTSAPPARHSTAPRLTEIEPLSMARIIARPPKSARYVSFPAAGVKLIQPAGFDLAEGFDGFQQPSTTSSLMVVTIPGSFSQVTAGFTAPQLKTRGMTLQSREKIAIEGREGLLISVTQSAYGIEFIKWMVAFGNDKDTKIVTATFPKERAAQLSDRLKSIVLSAKLDRTSTPTINNERAGFTIVASTKVKATGGFGKMLLYTKDGVVPAKSPADPIFIVAPSFSRVTIVDKEKFALQRLQQTAYTKISGVTATNPISIDGLNGYETIAEGEDSSSGTPLAVYQVMLFDDKSYYLMQGLVGTKFRSEYLTEFQAMARSFKRQRK